MKTTSRVIRDPPAPPAPAAQQSIINEEFAVGGAYAFLLRVSSFFGVAPLRFRPHGNGYLVSISIPMCIYSYILITVLAATATFIMFSKGQYGKMNTSYNSKLSEAVSKWELILFLITAAIGVYGASARMRCMLKSMNAMALVDQSIDSQYCQTKERRLLRGLVSFTFSCSMLVICEILIAMMVKAKGEWTMLIFYGVIYIIICLTKILQIQFVFTVMSVYTRFKAINQTLTNTINNTTFNNTSHLSVSYGTGVARPVLSGALSDTVQRIAMVQSLLYDLVHNINKSFGLILALMLTSLLIQLISTMYFAILKMLSEVLYGYEIMQCLWFCSYLLTLFMLVEPCHYTTEEGNKTESLVNRMIMESPPSGPLASRLELFARQLMLQRIGYEPMGFFSLNRSLVVSMFGIMVTYLVILLQFQD